MRTLTYFLADFANHKARLHQLGFIGAFLQASVKHRVFLKFDIKYGEYLPWYAKYFGSPLRLKKSMYGVTNSGIFFPDELTNWLIDEAGFNQ